MKILVTGSCGFIAGYLIDELLTYGYEVIGIDNHSKYGKVVRSYDQHPKYTFIEADAKDLSIIKDAIRGCTHFIAGAAMVGGISYFHDFPYDLLVENERITATAFDAAIWAYHNNELEKITLISSSMVYENAKKFPSKEGSQLQCFPPSSTYGFQKLAVEYFAKSAWEQYGLPFTIIRPFNCVGVGEQKAVSGKTVLTGNLNIALSHVITDFIQKIAKGQNPLHILGDGAQIRHFTYGGDIARGIRLSLENKNALNNDFNLSTDEMSTIIRVAEKIWKKIKPDTPFHYVCEKPYVCDVRKRIPCTKKAKRLLNFTANTKLNDVLDEVIPWVQEQIRIGHI